MSLTKYLKTIEGIDPGKIFVENIRSLYRIPKFAAVVLCETAVREEILIKKIGIICPNSDCNRIIESYDTSSDIAEIITCHICESENKEKSTFNTSDLDTIEFYQLKK